MSVSKTHVIINCKNGASSKFFIILKLEYDLYLCSTFSVIMSVSKKHVIINFKNGASSVKCVKSQKVSTQVDVHII